MKRRRPAVDYAVYLAVRLVVGVCQALSVEQSYRFADFLAGVVRITTMTISAWSDAR